MYIYIYIYYIILYCMKVEIDRPLQICGRGFVEPCFALYLLLLACGFRMKFASNPVSPVSPWSGTINHQ